MNNLKLYGRELEQQSFGRYKAEAKSKTTIDYDGISDKNGVASIYRFPFKIYGEENLPTLVDVADGFQYKVFPPMTVNASPLQNTVPLSNSVPFEQWPAFEWSTTVLLEDQLLPPQHIDIAYSDSPRVYNALRIDVSGPNFKKQAEIFSRCFLEWLRVLTSQSWINSYESYQESFLKYQFGIDELYCAPETGPPC